MSLFTHVILFVLFSNPSLGRFVFSDSSEWNGEMTLEEILRMPFRYTATLAFLFLATAALGQDTRETKLTPRQVPTAVTAALARQYPQARVFGWSKEVEAGKTTYETSVVDGSLQRDIVFAEDGSVVAVEEPVSITDLPAAVREAIRRHYPKASLRKAEKISHGSEVQYEVALAQASQKEVLLTPEGKILKGE